MPMAVPERPVTPFSELFLKITCIQNIHNEFEQGGLFFVWIDFVDLRKGGKGWEEF